MAQRSETRERTFTDVIFEVSNLANLTILHRRYGNVTSALGVLYPDGRPLVPNRGIIIDQRRGLTALLILWRRQCESLRPGISESSNSHVFFRILTQPFIKPLVSGVGGPNT